MSSSLNLTPEVMLSAYTRGIFPMAEARDSDELHWVEPRLRGVFPLDRFHISRSLRRRILAADHGVTVNAAFPRVVEACAARDETWINGPLFTLYQALHDLGSAHSLEVWRGDTLIGGVFGLTIGGAFFGESMFSRATDASKIALAYLVDRLRQGGFSLFDTQFLTPHLASLGAVEMPQANYLRLLGLAMTGAGDFRAPQVPSPQLLMQRSTQTS